MEGLILAFEGASSIFALVSSELDPGMPDNLISKRIPYCSSSSRSLRGFMFSICNCSTRFRNGSVFSSIMFEISSRRETEGLFDRLCYSFYIICRDGYRSVDDILRVEGVDARI